MDQKTAEHIIHVLFLDAARSKIQMEKDFCYLEIYRRVQANHNLMHLTKNKYYQIDKYAECIYRKMQKCLDEL
jgi:hypothetical protein